MLQLDLSVCTAPEPIAWIDGKVDSDTLEGHWRAVSPAPAAEPRHERRVGRK